MIGANNLNTILSQLAWFIFMHGNYHGHFFVAIDTDECDEQTDNCNSNRSVCENTDGSFTCQCRNGYSGNDTNCSGELYVLVIL